MKFNELGRTGIKVSRICLGTMTFGEQNTEDEGHRQLDMAYGHGVNFFDTAEAYSFPGRPETQGNSERIIGTWMKARKNRNKVIIATKIAGPSAERSHIRSGILKFTREQVAEAVDLSLKRLQTDTIDLYLTHWPERKANYFGRLDYAHTENEDMTPMEEQLDALTDQVKAGKIRAIGVSNETAWGLMKFWKSPSAPTFPVSPAFRTPITFFAGSSRSVSRKSRCGRIAGSWPIRLWRSGR